MLQAHCFAVNGGGFIARRKDLLELATEVERMLPALQADAVGGTVIVVFYDEYSGQPLASVKRGKRRLLEQLAHYAHEPMVTKSSYKRSERV